MMIGDVEAVNANCATSHPLHKKKPGSNEPGLKYWPREADTITFQEGLLSLRVTGGGGQIRNANAQRLDTMIRVEALQQPQKPHVSHAEIGGCLTRRKSGSKRRVRRRMIGFEKN